MRKKARERGEKTAPSARINSWKGVNLAPGDHFFTSVRHRALMIAVVSYVPAYLVLMKQIVILSYIAAGIFKHGIAKSMDWYGGARIGSGSVRKISETAHGGHVRL